MIVFQELTQAELAQVLLSFFEKPSQKPFSERRALSPEAAQHKARYHAKQLFHWVYQRFVTDWQAMTDLSQGLRQWLSENMTLFRLSAHTVKASEDGTQKFLWALPADQKTIESVLIPTPFPSFREAPSSDWKRLTACLSSQVGCAMGCKFCLTGIQGLDRSLRVAEIVTQVYELRRQAPVTHLVFMGMGEPMHNLDHVIKACRIFLDPDGFGFSKRKITISTSGLVPGIDRLGQELDVCLAISLNASTNAQRDLLMPVNKKWKIEDLLAACRRYPLGSHRRITFEYVLLGGLNDQLEDAARVADWIAEIPCKINLIPFNPHPGAPFQRPSDETVAAFQRFLSGKNITTTVRTSRGRDILAACGQLRSLWGTARGSERHRDLAPPQRNLSTSCGNPL